LDLITAQRLVAHALDEAPRFGKPICASVCDTEGFLVAFARMDGAPVRSIELSHCKAYSAARLGVTTIAFHERLQAHAMPATYFCDPRLTGLPGGSALTDATGRIVGGVGISGLAPSEDQEIADLLALAG
jgi:glc operon protein GlcG